MNNGAMTISLHGGGQKSYSIKHNKYHYSLPEAQRSIVVIKHMDLEDAYEDLFGDAVKKYNKKQKRKDRRMTTQKYLDQIKASAVQDAVQEIDVQVDGENSILDEIDEYKHHRAKPTRQEQCDMLIKYANDLLKNDKMKKNIYIVGIYLHLDETSPHLHIDYVPYAEGFKNGLQTRVSQERSLNKMGFQGGKKYIVVNKKGEWEERTSTAKGEFYSYLRCELEYTVLEYAKSKGKAVEVVHPMAGIDVDHVSQHASDQAKQDITDQRLVQIQIKQDRDEILNLLQQLQEIQAQIEAHRKWLDKYNQDFKTTINAYNSIATGDADRRNKINAKLSKLRSMQKEAVQRETEVEKLMQEKTECDKKLHRLRRSANDVRIADNKNRQEQQYQP